MATKMLAVAFLALLAVGLIVGLSPVRVLGVDCGSALAPEDGEAHVADLYDTFAGNSPRTGFLGGVAAECEEKISDRRPLAIALLVASGVAGFGALVTRTRPGIKPSG